MSFWTLRSLTLRSLTLRSLNSSATWTSGSGLSQHIKKHVKPPMKLHQRPGYLLVKRIYEPNHLPVPTLRTHRLRRNLAKCRDVEIVSEFRSKMRAAEEMISKLAFSLKEIQGMRKLSRPEKSTHTSSHPFERAQHPPRSKVARLDQLARPLVIVKRSEA